MKGVGELMQQNGPHAHTSGVTYKLFIGFRPLLVSIASYRVLLRALILY